MRALLVNGSPNRPSVTAAMAAVTGAAMRAAGAQQAAELTRCVRMLRVEVSS
ncbi:hypothetical protein [Kitasatospora sp. HPMI-4]|uniref:hypothetical protein n=1 Tax=Kitasatospora sp. HPMI-4 TaxID=3448443 RepID=UPI003F193E2E